MPATLTAPPLPPRPPNLACPAPLPQPAGHHRLPPRQVVRLPGRPERLRRRGARVVPAAPAAGAAGAGRVCYCGLGGIGGRLVLRRPALHRPAVLRGGQGVVATGLRLLGRPGAAHPVRTASRLGGPAGRLVRPFRHTVCPRPRPGRPLRPTPTPPHPPPPPAPPPPTP